MAYFPMYIDLTEKACLIVGGGKVAHRKALVLLDFGARVSVIAPYVCNEIRTLPVQILKKEFEPEDLNGKELVVCATDNDELNYKISEYCRNNKIPVNVVDKAEYCSFIFPSYVKENNLVASFSSGGNSPLLTQILKKEAIKTLTPFLSEINEYLGSVRNIVKERASNEEQRKRIYERLYSLAISKQRIPNFNEFEEIISDEL